ncbi:MAG: formaldehyde-activating enzyme [Euryarchaeota archaeon]|jgi:5,6,7,8-tetrahydromethanopterin hydro-lyase|nr:formaldehyde-activating enzyme [Euryarchaeota archaeon]HNS25531.1 formaldehyde-activating enzyme [Methanobacteriaceae archaeon]
MYLAGEALVGDGAEVSHIDLLIGDKEGPVGQAFANALANQVEKHTPLFAVVTPNLVAKPITMLLPKVSIRDLDDATKIFGPAQKAVAMAVVDSVEEGIIPKEMVEDICILCGVFIHPQAQDADKIYEYNYQATRISIKRAFASEPDINEIIEKKNLEGHPFYK